MFIKRVSIHFKFHYTLLVSLVNYLITYIKDLWNKHYQIQNTTRPVHHVIWFCLIFVRLQREDRPDGRITGFTLSDEAQLMMEISTTIKISEVSNSNKYAFLHMPTLQQISTNLKFINLNTRTFLNIILFI